MTSIFNASTKTVFKYGSVTAGGAAIVNDVLTPLSKLGLWVAFLALLLAVIAFIIGRQKPDIFESSNTMKELWYLPLTLCFILVAFSTTGMYLFNKKNNNESGLLSKHSEVVKLLQKDLGILDEINTTLESIDGTTKKIDKNTSTTANILIDGSYNEYDFIESVANGDIPRLKSYLNDYWKNTYQYPRMTGEVFILFEGIRTNSTETIVDVLELFYQHGKLEPFEIYNHPLPLHAPKNIYQKMVEDPINKKNEQKYLEYKLAKENAAKQNKLLKSEVDRKIEQHCSEVDEQNKQAEIDHAKAKIEWESLYQKAVEDENKKRLAAYVKELSEHEKGKLITQQEYDAFNKRSVSDFKSREEWRKVSIDVQTQYRESLYSLTPRKPMKVFTPDNYQELRAIEPPLTAPFAICNQLALRQKFVKEQGLHQTVPHFSNEYVPSLGRSKLSLLQYAIAIQNEHAMKYLYSLSGEKQQVHVQLFDYNNNLIFESPLISGINY